MKNKLILFGSLILLTVVFAACSNDEENNNTSVSTNESGHSDEVAENLVRITISINDGEQFINEEEVEIEAGENLLEILRKTFFIETDEEDTITSIERMQVEEEEGTTWVLFVNDDKVDIPAKDYTVSGGERIIFDLQ